MPRASAQDTQVTKNAPAGTNILRFDGDAAAIQALLSGQVDAVGGNMFYIDRLNEAKPGIYENKLEFSRIYNGACTRLGEKEINASINAFIDQIKANGELAKIHQKWMKLPLPSSSRTAWKAFRSWPADRPSRTVLSDMTNQTGNPASISAIQPMIVMQGVEKWFGSFQALTDINLTVRAGEKIVLCGPSGSGKSTLIRCINHLETYQKGRILVDGTLLDDNPKTIDTVRREVGMVFQQFNLFPHMTVMQNCTLAPMRVRGASKADAEATARRLLARVQILDQAEKYPAQLSGGQQQRVAIARALCMEPKVMLFDEPTSRSIPRWSRKCSIP